MASRDLTKRLSSSIEFSISGSDLVDSKVPTNLRLDSNDSIVDQYSVVSDPEKKISHIFMKV